MLRRRLRRSLDHGRTFLGLPPKKRSPLSNADREPVAGEGAIRDPGHLPDAMRAPCGRPPPGERPQPADFTVRDAEPTIHDQEMDE